MTTFRLKLCTHVPTYTIYQKFQHTKKYIFECDIKSEYFKKFKKYRIIKDYKMYKKLKY